MGIVSIRSPKTRRTRPRQQQVTIENRLLLNWLTAFVATTSSTESFFPEVRELNKLLKAWIERLLAQPHRYTLGRFRGGGATHFWLTTENL